MVTLGTLSVVALLLGASSPWPSATARSPPRPTPTAAGVDVDTIGRGPLVSPSVFPILGAFGVALLLLGLAFDRWYTIFGAVLLVGVTVEWLVQAWSDRASDDAEYNRRPPPQHDAPDRVPGPRRPGGRPRDLRLLAGDAHRDKNAAVVVFIVVGRPGPGRGVALRRRLRRIGGDVLVGTLMVGGVIVLTAGVISVVQGERGFHEPRGRGRRHRDGGRRRRASRLDSSSRAAALSPDELTVPRAAQVSLTFNNSRSGPPPARRGGGRGPPVAPGRPPRSPSRAQSAFVEDGQTTFLTFKFTLPGTFTFLTEGEDGTDRIEGTVVAA